jgi:hypothetical protein
MRVINDTHLGCPLIFPVGTVISGQTLKVLSNRFADDKPLSDREKFQPYVIRNSSGCVASFYSVPKNGVKPSPIPLPMGASEPVVFDEGVATKLRHGATHSTNVHKVAIKLDGWFEVQPAVTVDRVGTFVFLMKPEPENIDNKSYGARFSADIYTLGCHWFPRLLA